MPLGEFQAEDGATVKNFGTDADGFPVSHYCFMCYRNGAFVEPELTLAQMIERSVDHMTSDQQMNEDDARHLANDVIPGLKRWQ
jgi:hypothetical protein